MKVKTKITGNLGKYVQNYETGQEIEIILNESALVADLIKALNIPESEALFVTRGDKILSKFEEVKDNDRLTVVQAFEGG